MRLDRDHDQTITSTSGTTIFHHLLESEDVPPADRNMKFFLSESISIVGAGQVTTANHISITLFHVFSNADILSTLKAELERAILDPGKLPALAELEELEYLTAVSISVSHRAISNRADYFVRIGRSRRPQNVSRRNSPSPTSFSARTHHIQRLGHPARYARRHECPVHARERRALSVFKDLRSISLPWT